MDRIASATWRRLDVPGTDTCTLLRGDGGWGLEGFADFNDRAAARVSYRVECTSTWSTQFAEIKGTMDARPLAHRIERAGAAWLLDDNPQPAVDGLVDIDFGFTPATNFLLMKRLSFPMGEPQAVSVAWFDLGEKMLASLPQRYTRRGPREFWYESPTAGYAGLLVLADNGFVQAYPGLWALDASS
jgi:hypothetical protein